MGSFSIWHWLIVLAIVVLVFGAGRLPRVMGDLAKGIKSFKSGMKEEETAQTPPPAQPMVQQHTAGTTTTTTTHADAAQPGHPRPDVPRS